MVAYNGLQQLNSTDLFAAMEEVLEGSIETVFFDYNGFSETVSNVDYNAEVLFSPLPAGDVIQIFYFKMIGKDSGLPGTNYISWVVQDTPDYAGDFAPVTVGPLVDIYVSSIKEG
jgi:hypothetical protein